MTILVLGAGGLLGSAFVDRFQANGVVAAGRDRLIGSHLHALDRLIEDAEPDVVVNCAADTDVEGAERDASASSLANEQLPGRVAAACRSCGAVLVQVSSTGCYGDYKGEPFDDDDVARPTTTHHRHKLAGEDRVRQSGCEALILRTGWLFGGKPNVRKNFVWNRLMEARFKSQLASDPFQRGNPTLTRNVASQCALLLERGIRGTFNCVSGPATSRLDYVREIIRCSNLPCEVRATDAPFRRLAQVSPNEAATNRRLEEIGLAIMKTLTETLPAYISSMMSSDEWKGYDKTVRIP